jgi:ribokinase
MQSPIIVFGSINMDLVVYSEAKPNDGETVIGNSFETFLGGKGSNQAVAASKLGANVSFVGKVGSDLYGQKLKEQLNLEKVNTQLLDEIEGESGVALINVIESSSENQIIVIPGANAHVSADQIDDKTLSSVEILISQLEVPPNQIEVLFSRARQGHCYRVLNVAPAIEFSTSLFNETDLLVVNEIELEALAKKKLKDTNIDSIRASVDLLSLAKHQAIVVTLGAEGVYVRDQNKDEYIEGHKVNSVDTTGSGDCFVGAMASYLIEDKNLFDASVFANKAASISVTRKGASSSMPTKEEVVNLG